MSNVDRFEIKWKEIRGNVRQRWPALTKADVNLIDGHVDVLVDLLEEKCGYSRSLAEDEMRQFLQKIHTARAR